MSALPNPTEGVTTLPAVPSGGGLVAAIASVMNEVHVVAKRGENEFHKYRYATMGDILKEITPLLGRHGIVIFQSEVGRAMFDDDNVIAVEYAFTVAHASGETWPHPLRQTGVSTCRNTKGGWDDKCLNKCHTAARKYFLLALFQIPTGNEEDDADRGESERRDTRRRPAAVPKQDAAPVFNRLRGELDAITALGDLQEWGDNNGVTIATFPADWQKALRLRFSEKLTELRPAPQVVKTVTLAPKHALKAGGIADRAIAARNAQGFIRPAGPSQTLRVTRDGVERLPPLNVEMNDELPGDLGPPEPADEGLDIPPSLDRRRKATSEPTYLDLVGEGSR
jgi:ERF superfamily